MMLVVALVCASAAPPAPPDPALSVYAKPDRIVSVSSGRKMHIRCMGAGSPTVILTAGLGDWGFTWRNVQGRLAQTTRTCAWDRAGSGYSDASPDRQDVLHTTRDLERLLRVGRIGPPYVLVGHSLGSFETLLFAYRHPQDVVGIVLVDPSVPRQYRRFEAVAPRAAAFVNTSRQEELATLRACIDRARRSRGAALGPAWADCANAPPDDYPQDLKAALKRMETNLGGAQNLLSLSINWERSSRQLTAASRPLGDIPLTVLTAGEPLPLPGELAQDGLRMAAEWKAMHDEVAGLSTAGSSRVVDGAGHHIQQDRPDAVVAAVNEIVAAARRRAR